MNVCLRMSVNAAGLLLALGWLLGGAPAGGQTTAPGRGVVTAPAAGAKVVLDTAGSWRIYQCLKPPVIQLDEGPKAVQATLAWLNWDSPEAPANWREPDFDDTTWLRASARGFAQTPYLGRLCLRGKFDVPDPAAARDLLLWVSYHGGIVVHLNGRQIARDHIPADSKGPQALADGYPLGAFVAADGTVVPPGWRADSFPKSVAQRVRKLEAVKIPAEALRAGTNVLAIEVVRAPYHKVLEEKKMAPRTRDDNTVRGSMYELNWNTCEVLSARLTSGGGAETNVGRGAELQAWNSDMLWPDHDSDAGDRCEILRPITIVGARNGSFSGKVVLGAPGAIAGVKAFAGDLKAGAGAGTISASCVQVRYGAAWGNVNLVSGSVPRGAATLGMLLEAPPEQVAASASGGGAVAPVWVTVRVPKDAPAGAYAGELKIQAKGLEPLSVPIRLQVADWTLPDTQDYKTWIELVQSPDTLAVEYGLELWSDKHFDLIARSMDLIGQAGSRVVYVPLIAETNYGNEESMVRWVPKPGGGYDFDFSVMDRYLDVAQKHMGRPRLVVFQCWESYMKPAGDTWSEKWWNSLSPQQRQEGDYFWTLKQRGDKMREIQAQYGVVPVVSVLDSNTEQYVPEYVNVYNSPAGKAVWGRLFSALRERMRNRGLESAMAIGMVSDTWPTKEEVVFLKEVSGGLPWVTQCHGGGYASWKIYDTTPVCYVAYAWNVAYAPGPDKMSLGWKLPRLVTEFRRFNDLNVWPPASVRHFPEIQITGEQRGLGRVGADFWPVIKDKAGRRAERVYGRYPQSQWRNLDIGSYMLAPGPAGPVAAARFEWLREGVQECEARIAIEQALDDRAAAAKLGGDLASRCREALRERMQFIVPGASTLALGDLFMNYAAQNKTVFGVGGASGQAFFACTGWQERSLKLYSLAGEVQRKLGAK